MRISDWSSDVCSSDGYYGIYQNSRDGDTAWTQNSGCNHFPHLCNNFSSAVVSSKCNRVAIKVSRFVFEGDISSSIRVGSSDDAHINFEGFEAKVFFNVELMGRSSGRESVCK